MVHGAFRAWAMSSLARLFSPQINLFQGGVTPHGTNIDQLFWCFPIFPWKKAEKDTTVWLEDMSKIMKSRDANIAN